MKKLLALLLVFVMLFAFAACGDSDDSSDNAELEEYIDSIQDEIDEAIDEYEAMGMSIKVVARGDSLAYVYRFTTEVEDVDAARNQLKSGISAQDSVFENVLKELKKEVKSAESVIVEYQNKDGSVIYSKEYD